MDEALKVDAARAIMAHVESKGRAMTLREVKAETMPRSSWAHFADVCLSGHRAGVLVLSRVDLVQVYGTPETTGEIVDPRNGAEYHWIKPSRWIA